MLYCCSYFWNKSAFSWRIGPSFSLLPLKIFISISDIKFFQKDALLKILKVFSIIYFAYQCCILRRFIIPCLLFSFLFGQLCKEKPALIYTFRITTVVAKQQKILMYPLFNIALHEVCCIKDGDGWIYTANYTPLGVVYNSESKIYNMISS